MTSLQPALTMLAAWLRPVLATIDDETMNRSRTWVVALADADDVYIEDLAKAAFGKASPELIDSLERTIAAAAPTYAPEGKATLVAHLAAASLLHIVDGGADPAVDVTCHCKSLLFLGWTPVISDLPARLEAFCEENARAVRTRVPLDGTIRPPRKRSNGGGPATDDISALSASVANADALLAKTLDRIEKVVEQFNDRVALLDEEIDALWWARSDRSATTGQAWTDLDTLPRAILAGIEAAAIVGVHMPTAGTLTVLNQIIGTSGETYDLIDVIAALRDVGWSGASSDDDAAPFRPLAAGIALTTRFGDDPVVVGAALRSSLQLPDGHQVSARSVAHQLLNENALRSSDD